MSTVPKDTKAFEATATTGNEISNSATAAATGENDDVATATAVNITNYDTKTNVNVNRAINAENGSINLDSTNTFKNSLSAGSVTGSSVKPIKDWTEVAGPDFLNSISNNIAAKLTSSLQKTTENVPEGADGSTFE